MNRLSKDEYYLQLALAAARRSTCLKRKYGCIIVKNNEVIATGYNGSPRGFENCCDLGICQRINEPHNSGNYSNCHSVHAEQNALISAARRDMIDSTLYLAGYELGQEVTDCIPCPICARMIVNAGVVNVINRKSVETGLKIDLKRLV